MVFFKNNAVSRGSKATSVRAGAVNVLRKASASQPALDKPGFPAVAGVVGESSSGAMCSPFAVGPYATCCTAARGTA